ncbi:uncharacterized protein HMPREF1541_05458 [Cyphellophora europaea CBS 101466]|uniref:Ran-binding-domain-containing protein n=1 Tax=Cyphellophora europaea (strain CBS 101466) TaxID=1220924 RepID=W2RSE2_CYPE1|nr:uncharacterized protein HMPREF1541_05458 [Cyphellophora europaea CBS 101466]ETN39235.1 hypothetical protein HMPREF1541_05458 [Cyphellophora europaea CBS 101466]
MDVLLGKVTQQAMNYAIRSGIALTASYAIQQSNKLLRHVPRSTAKDELYSLRQKLQNKVQIVSPAIDMIELLAARGNTSLESALVLTKDLRYEIQTLGQRLARAAQAVETSAKTPQAKAAAELQHELELKGIVADIKALLGHIDDALPLINLAITTSGASLSTNLPHTVSPSRLLQASHFLSMGDTQYSMSPHTASQIGPTFTLTVYMLFAGHSRPQTEEDMRETTWKEVMHKARVKVRRVPIDTLVGGGLGSTTKSDLHEANFPADARSDEFAYQLVLVEDLDDDRVHDFEDDQVQPGPFDEVALAGIRESLPIHEISKIFYADTSKVLNIGTDAEANHPVLLLKRDINAIPPRRMMHRTDGDGAQESNDSLHPRRPSLTPHHNDPWHLPPSLDPEWIALEVYSTDGLEGDDASSNGDVTDTSINGFRPTPSLDEEISHLHISSPSPAYARDSLSPSADARPLPLSTSQTSHLASPGPTSQAWTPQIRTSLSLLELLLRLTSLQQFQQQSHLSITDELLNFFLEESATTGAGGDENYRQALRADARRRVGWDPYDESPMKRRGEDYQYGGGPGWSSPAPSANDYASPSGSEREGTQPSQGPRATPVRGQSYNDGWNPSPRPGSVSGLQTRSMTRASQTPSQSPEPAKGREQWLRRDSGKGKSAGSPLRPGTGRSDEGLGTSPVSGMDGVRSP